MNESKIDETIQILRTLKIAQIRKQFEQELREQSPMYMDGQEWYVRAQIVSDFIKAAKEQA